MFIGRTRELALLRTALDADPMDASHRAVFLEGAVGSGKTALVDEFLADRRGTRVLFARADEFGSGVPFDGVRDILESLLESELDAVLEGQESPRSLLRSVRAALAAAPALLVIDDAHWLDPASVVLLEQLLLEPDPVALRFLLVHRTGGSPRALSSAARRSGSEMHRLVLAPRRPGEAGGAPLEGIGLTPRERTVAELVAEGHSNRDIAAALHLSPRTVETHVSRILRKTGLRSRAGLARRLDAAG
jgi:DNA-binding NarL/FixJ family response regulator